MNESKLKTAVLGLNDKGKLLLDAAQKSGYFQIQAVADKTSEAAEQAARQYQCTAYDDYRQLIIQNQFDCLLAAESIHSCDEYLRMAMKKKFNILKLSPPARNFEEAAQFVRMAEDENIKFTFATMSRFTKSFLALRQFLLDPKCSREKLISPELSSIESALEGRGVWEPFLVTAFCTATNDDKPNWQTDPKLAGGGILLYDCYDIIDQIVLNFGTPQQVYCLSTNTAGDKQQRLYLTENTAVVTMKYTDTLFVNLLAGNALGPQEKRLSLYGKGGIISTTDTELTINNNLEQKSETLRYTDDERARTAEMLENFALSIISPANKSRYASGTENLKNMAVIEAAYLSSKTGFPEEPRRILEMQRL